MVGNDSCVSYYCTEINYYTTFSSLGALGDSFYEYLIKSWIQVQNVFRNAPTNLFQTNFKDDQARRMYWDASDAIQRKWGKVQLKYSSAKRKTKTQSSGWSSPPNRVFVSQPNWREDMLISKMEMDPLLYNTYLFQENGSSRVFLCGNVRTRGEIWEEWNEEGTNYAIGWGTNHRHHIIHYLLLQDLGHTCHESYIRTESRIGPEMFYFNDQDDATSKWVKRRNEMMDEYSLKEIGTRIYPSSWSHWRILLSMENHWQGGQRRRWEGI